MSCRCVFDKTKRTVDARPLRLTVSEQILRWSGRCIHARWSMAWHVPWHTWLPGLLLWRRSQARTTLPAASHNSLEEIRWTVTNGWWRLVRWAYVRTLRRASSLLEFMSETCDFVLISATRQSRSYFRCVAESHTCASSLDESDPVGISSTGQARIRSLEHALDWTVLDTALWKNPALWNNCLMHRRGSKHNG
jgi:hypothetical protein